MQAVRDITKPVWGSAKELAEAIDEPYERVRKWLQRGRIPDYAWPAMIRKSRGKLTAEILMKANQPRRGRAA